MTSEPFFEPWPEPGNDVDDQPDLDHPWVPPVHVVGVVVPLDVPVVARDDVVVRLTHALSYQRGLELHVGTWQRPGTRRAAHGAPFAWQVLEPRVGFRLADGTRLGHRAAHGPSTPDGGDRDGPILAQTGGHGGGLRFAQSWWLSPFPAGDHLEVVVEWPAQGVPETAARVDLRPLREAASRESVLWPPPPSPGELGEGWFGFSGP